MAIDQSKVVGSNDGLEALELRISKFLRAGVLVAGSFMALGWLINVATMTDTLAALQHYDHLPLQRDLELTYGHQNWARLISYGGLMVLIALPFTRVVLTAVLFVRQREWVLAAVAAFVSVTLLVSVLLGIDL